MTRKREDGISESDLSNFLVRCRSEIERRAAEGRSNQFGNKHVGLSDPQYQLISASALQRAIQQIIPEVFSKFYDLGEEKWHFVWTGFVKMAESLGMAEINSLSHRMEGDRSSPQFQLLSTVISGGINAALASTLADLELQRRIDAAHSRKKDPRSIFVVQGRNTGACDELIRFLRAADLEPIDWVAAEKLTRTTSPTTMDIVVAGMGKAQAIIVLFTGDDLALLHPDFQGDEKDFPSLQPRPNVLLEAGLAFGLARHFTIFVELGKLRGLSDLHGFHAVRLSNSPESRRSLLGRLQTAGCPVPADLTTLLDPERFNFEVHIPKEFDAKFDQWLSSQESISAPTPSNGALKVLNSICKDEGEFFIIELDDVLILRSGEKGLEARTPRDIALVWAAIQELNSLGLIDSEQENLYKLTNAGFEFLDQRKPDDPE